MTHVTQQTPYLCYYACIQSILHDRGMTNYDQRRLFDFAGGAPNLFIGDAYKKLAEKIELPIRKEDEKSTAWTLEHYPAGNVVVVLRHMVDPEDQVFKPLSPQTHAVRIAPVGSDSSRALVMDPWDNPRGLLGIPRRSDGLIECSLVALDEMRSPPGGKPSEYYVIG